MGELAREKPENKAHIKYHTGLLEVSEQFGVASHELIAVDMMTEIVH